MARTADDYRPPDGVLELSQQLLEHSHALVHVLFLEQEWREESEHRVLGAVEEYALRESLFHDGARGNVELQALYQAAAANFASYGIAFHQRFQLLLQIRADADNMLQQVLFFDDGQILECDPARQWASAESGSMLPRGDRRRELFLDEKGAERDSRGDGLGDGDDVRSHAESLEGEDGSGAAEPALDLIENQRGTMAVGEGSAFFQKLHGTLVDSTFAEDGFEHDGASVVVHRGAQSFSVVARDKLHVLEQRLKTFAVFVLPGYGHGSETAAVIRAFERDQLALGGASGTVPGEARKFDGAFDRFGAAVRKEGAL